MLLPTTSSPRDAYPAGLIVTTVLPNLLHTNAPNACEVEWNVRASLKLNIALSRRLQPSVLMDDDSCEHIIQLCTHIGIIMENASGIALRIGRVEDDNQIAQLNQFNEATARIGQLIDPCFAHLEE